MAQSNTRPHSWTARWIIPGDGRVLSGGTITVVDGRIIACTSRRESSAQDLGDVVILPGLVNCHAHLEFSELTQPLSPAVPFTDWLRSLMAWRRGHTADVGAAVALGLKELASHGCTRVGEIATAGWSPRDEYLDAPVIHAFREAIGLRIEAIEEQNAIVEGHLRECREVTERSRARTERGNPSRVSDAAIMPAVSPHAPYSVRPELLERLVDLAVARNLTVAMHLAETRDELLLLAEGRGPFVDFLAGLGVWRPDAVPPGRRPLDLLRRLARSPRALVVHGNYLADDELTFLAANPHLSLVYCPRTHAFFEHEPHPWKKLVAMGGRVVLGTDGRGSNPDLSLFREACFLAGRHPDVDPALLLRMLTHDAAVALSGADADYGRLEPGRRADLCVIRMPTGREPLAELFHPDSVPVGTMVGGRWLVSPPALG